MRWRGGALLARWARWLGLAVAIGAACTAGVARAAGTDPDLALALGAEGEAAQEEGDNARALDLYTRAIELGTLSKEDLAGMYSNRGSAQKALGRLEPALADYERAIALDPGLVIAYNNRGQALVEKGDLKRAVADYTQALRLNPEYPSPYFNRSVAYERLGELEKARKDAERFAALLPDHPWAKTRLAYLDQKLAERGARSPAPEPKR